MILFEAAESLIRVATYDDHSDLGLQICQQNTASQLVNALSYEWFLGSELEALLTDFASKCFYPVSPSDQGSARLLSIAQFIIRNNGSNQADILSEISRILLPTTLEGVQRPAAFF